MQEANLEVCMIYCLYLLLSIGSCIFKDSQSMLFSSVQYRLGQQDRAGQEMAGGQQINGEDNRGKEINVED